MGEGEGERVPVYHLLLQGYVKMECAEGEDPVGKKEGLSCVWLL